MMKKLTKTSACSQSRRFFRYTENEMAIWHRLKLILACFLAAVCAGGAVLPPPAVWQCRHAVRVVDAAWTGPRSAAMPCRMGDAPMALMACCLPSPAKFFPAASSRRPALAAPACHPVLVSLAALPLANAPQAQAHLRRSLAVLISLLPLSAALVPPVPAVLSRRQRPPPTLGFAQSAPAYSFGLRAPPAA